MQLVTRKTEQTIGSRDGQIGRFWTYARTEGDLPTLLDRAVAAVATALELDWCAVLKLSSSRDALHVIASVGWPEALSQHAVLPSGARSQEAYTLATATCVTSADLARETRFHPAFFVLDYGLRGSISVAVDGETAPFGLLVGHTRKARRFSPADVEFASSMAQILTESVRRMHADRDRARLSAIVDSANDAIIGTTLDGTIFGWNQAAEAMFGFQKAEVVGRKTAMLFPAGHAPSSDRSSKPAAHAERTGPYETVCQRRDGTSIDVEIAISPIALAEGKIVGESLIVRDVSQRIRHERALRTHVDVLGRMQIGIVVCRLEEAEDPSSLRLTLANPAGASACGFELETSPGQRLIDLCPPFASADYLHRSAEVAWTGRSYDFGDRTFDSAVAAEVRVFNMHAFPLPDQSVGIVLHDVTAQRQLADQLQHAQRLGVIGRLAGGVAHDFNNLLTVIGGYADMLQEKVSRDETLREDLVQIQHAADSASALTRQLLTFSRRQTGEPTRLDLTVVVDRLRGMLRRIIGEDIQLVVLHDARPAPILADVGQVEQIVLNLVVNARDAMPAGGHLAIETDIVRAPGDRRTETAGQSYVRLTVADTGTGMDQRTRERIFEPFFTTKEIGRGTGLGLSTVHAIVTENHGHIEVESEPGQGTIFRIYLPQADSIPVEALATERVREIGAGSETILVVEDEESVRMLVRGLLAKAGYSVLAASSASEALALFNRHPVPIDLLLTDIVMPHQTGRDLAELAAATRPLLRVLYMSGYPQDVVAARGALALGAPFLAKPFTAAGLLSAVRHALDDMNAGLTARTPTTIQ